MSQAFSEAQFGVLEAFHDRLPTRPLCADNYENGVYRRKQGLALQAAHIEHSVPGLKSWIVMDIDRADAGVSWADADLPQPSWTAINETNGHAHLAWGLRVPVATHPAARQAPVRYLAAIEGALTSRLKADRAYTGLITKNPMSPVWRKRWGTRCDFTLGEIGNWLEAADFTRQDTLESTSQDAFTGRNVALFDHLRTFAYASWSKVLGKGINADQWYGFLLCEAQTINSAFHVPLGFSEMLAVCKSVSGWTWKNYNPKKFSALQAARGRRKAGRFSAGRQAAESMLKLGMKLPGPRAEVAENLGISVATLRRAMKADATCPTRKPWIEAGISRATWYRKRGER